MSEQPFNIELARKLVSAPRCQLSTVMQRQAVERIDTLQAQADALADKLDVALAVIASWKGGLWMGEDSARATLESYRASQS